MARCYACFQECDDNYTFCPYCGHPRITQPKEPIHLLPGTVLYNRYIIGESVGSGGFGIVYKAWDTKLETIVAIKEFFVSRLVTRAAGEKDLIVNRKSLQEYKYRKDRFLAEARTMARFGSHRSITNVFEFFEEHNTAYIVMELLIGMPLNEYIAINGGRMSLDFSLYVVNEVANALFSMHEQGVIHKDVAPDNIFICSGTQIRIKLIDLGAAKLADFTDEVVDIVLKPGYSPVEQYDNSKSIGPWTDIYALGATLYMMVTGVKPDESTNRKIADELVPPIELNPEISENLNNTILKAMAIDKHMRFKTISDFLLALNGQKKVVSLKKERRRKRTRWISGIAAACLVLTAGLGVCAHMYSQKKAEAQLEPASISVWFSVQEGSGEAAAMESVRADFQKAFPGVKLNLEAIPEADYADRLTQAARDRKLPQLFESTGVSPKILAGCQDLDPVLETHQFQNCLFLDQYHSYYGDTKQLPLAIEVPLAYVVTSGAACIPYDSDYFSSLSDFGTDVNICADIRYESVITPNFLGNFSAPEEFLNNTANTSPVLLSSTMMMNEVRTTLTNYEKNYVYYRAPRIFCSFTYEWSIGGGSDAQQAAAQRLLSWMLGNVYQTTLMITECSDGQIPVNPLCFETKIQARNLTPIGEIYESFLFDREEGAQ